MSRHNINIQDGFLFQCLKNKLPVHINLVTGRAIEGRLKRFDRFALLLDHEEKELLVYKHAIATLEAGEAAE